VSFISEIASEYLEIKPECNGINHGDEGKTVQAFLRSLRRT
jgi:hypothetical protein